MASTSDSGATASGITGAAASSSTDSAASSSTQSAAAGRTDLIASLPLATKVALLSGRDVWHTCDLPEAGVRAVAMSDGPHGLRRQATGGDHLGATGSEPATCFPTAAALACSWDPALLAEVGAAIAAEAAQAGVDVVLGPGLNIKRHPFGGRNFEYFSEDPLLTGVLAAAMVTGIQRNGTAACLKHFAVNNQEDHRLVVDAVVDERTLREIYLAGFEIAVKQSAPATVMAAYNRVNGTYCCEHPGLLTQILRDEWGFAGLVISDWGATNDRAAGVAAGMDLEMPNSGNVSDDAVVSAVAAGQLPTAAVDDCVRRVLHLADRPPAPRRPVDYDAHHRLARDAAARSMVLLTNNGLLPLADPGSVAVVGAFAEHPRYQGSGSSLVNPTRLDSFLSVLRNRGGSQLVYAPGYDPTRSGRDDSLLAAAVDTARRTDVAVVLVGLPGNRESEGFDRRDLSLPEQHDRLVAAVCDANPNTVVVLANGSPVAMPWVDRPAAILECYLGGQAGAAALADVLFGDREPGGRLAESFPLRAADVPSHRWFPGDGRRVEYREGIFVGYRYYDTAGAAVLFPFGHGLSYTTFDYGQLRLEQVQRPDLPQQETEPPAPGSTAVPGTGGAVLPDDPPLLRVVVPVTNTGDRAGSEVVQVYVGPAAGRDGGREGGHHNGDASGPAAGREGGHHNGDASGPATPAPGAAAPDAAAPDLRPVRELRGFARVSVPAGQTREAVIVLGSRAFAHYDPAIGDWRAAAGDYDIQVGSSSRRIRRCARVRLTHAAGQDREQGPDAAGPDREQGHDLVGGLMVAECGAEPAPAATAAPPPRPSGDRADRLLEVLDRSFAERLGRPQSPPEPIRPFHRNSTIADLRLTSSGRLLRAGLLRLLRQPLVEMAGEDDEALGRLLAAADEAPLRTIALFSGGLITWPTLDAVIAWLNGRRGAALLGLRPAVTGQFLPAVARQLRLRRR